MPDLITRPLASASVAAMAALIGFLLVSVNSQSGGFLMLLVAIPCLASLLVNLPEPRFGPYVLSAVAAVAITALIAGAHVAGYSDLDRNSGDLFNSGFEAAIRLGIPATIPAGILLYLQERRIERGATADGAPGRQHQPRRSPRAR